MNIVHEELSPLHLLITVTLEPQDLEADLNAKLKEYRKDIQLKGFRKGHVPLSVVRGMAGQQALSEVVSRKLGVELDKYVKDNELRTIGYPLNYGNEKVELNVKDMQPYTFKFEAGIEPSFELPLMDGSATFDKKEVKLDDSEVDEEINKLRKAYGEQGTTEEVLQESDVINVELVELDDSGEPKEDGLTNDTVMAVNQFTDDAKAELLNIKKGDSVVLNIFEALDHPKETIADHILDLSPEFLDTVGEQFKLTVTEAKRVTMSEMDQVFFDKVFGEGEVDSEDSFKERFRGELENLHNHFSQVRLRNQVADRLMSSLDLEFPEQFLLSWIKANVEKELSEEEMEKELAGFKNMLKFSLLKRKIGEDYKDEIGTIKDEDLLNYAMKDAEMHYKSRFQFIVNEDNFKGMISNALMSDEKYRTQKVEDLFQQKVLDLVLEKNAVVTEEVALVEFLNENANA